MSKLNFYDEIKFNKISKNNIDFAKFVTDCLFDTRSLNFYSYTTHKDSKYFQNNFAKDIWSAYEKITLKLLGAALAEKEIIILIADHITTPKDVKFEVNLKKNFNKSKKRLALSGVCRFDSKSNDLLQIVDLIIGCVTYDIKYQNKLVSGDEFKLNLVEYVKNKLGTETFTKGFKNYSFNVFVEQDNGIETIEKGLSS